MHDVRLHDLSIRGREARFAIETALDTSFGRLTIIATHLGLRAGEGRQQIERLSKIIETIDGLIVAIGDFNDCHGHVRHTLFHCYQVVLGTKPFQFSISAYGS